MKDINNLKEIINYYGYANKPVIIIKNNEEHEIDDADNFNNDRIIASQMKNGILTVWL